LSGITTRTWTAPDGRVDAEVVAGMMRPDAGPYFVSTAAVVVENTHNFGGGTVQPLDEVERLRELTRSAGVAMHLAGARLWNAHVATGVPLATYGRLFDTVSVCLSKGLGAPVGSVLACSAERIAEARVWRKRLGGGMRQAGVLAAAGLYALDHHLDRLADDHARARRLADAVAEVAPGLVDPAAVETNIVVLETPGAGELVRRCREQDVLVSQLDQRHARVVTHLDVDDEQVEQAAKVLREAARA
jgi:threonine aldolase